jgi:hypothetical protein
LAATLASLAEAAADLRDPWWIIGSAAMALHGAGPLVVADVDLLASPDDARSLAARWGLAVPAARPDPRFRSEVYFQWTATPLPVDVMGGFQVRAADGWRPLVPATRRALTLADGATVFTPDVAEQISILQAFGRDKDLARVALLRALRPG